MSELHSRDSARPDVRLSRRSLIAAAGILAAAGPGAASKALAFSSSKPTKIHWNKDSNDACHSKCAVCFLRGTRLLTPDGEIAIEALQIGDAVVTESGAVRAIRWIGRMSVGREPNGLWSEDVQPIRVTKDAFGRGSPRRDLYLSRAHMVHLNGVLVPIGDLINGRSIAPVNLEVDSIEYFHVELDTHDVVMVEGAPCESLLLAPGKLWSFDNFEEYLTLYGVPAREVTTPCAPIASFNGGRGALKSRLRSALAPVIDCRHPLDIARDDIEARALIGEAA